MACFKSAERRPRSVRVVSKGGSFLSRSGHAEARFPVTRSERVYGDRVVRCFVERPRSLFALLESAVSAHPDAVALVAQDTRLTYRDLDQWVARVSCALVRSGVGPADRVALMLGNRVEFVVVMFAAARLGAIVVPLSIREVKAGLIFTLGQCGARVLVHEGELSAQVPHDKDLAAPLLRVRVGNTDHEGAPAIAWQAWLHGAAVDTPREPARPAETDTAAILYTSGTTGRPKGAMLTHLGLAHSAMHFVHAMSLGPRDCSIAAVPLSHVTGLVALIATTVLAAGKLVIMPAFRASAFIELAQAEAMTHTVMVPAMYKLCLMEPRFSQADLSAWRIGAYGGAPMPEATIAELAGQLPHLMLMNCYGSTETTSPATLMPPGQSAGQSDSVGCALPCAQIHVMDDQGRECPPGELGEIWIGGPMVIPGYWNNDEATRAAFAGGFWRSGDLGWMDANGYLRVVDRIKDMINRGGYKVFTIEVENVLYEHEAVVECAVVPVPCPVLGERVNAVVYTLQKSPNHEALNEQLRAYCAARLADYKVPERFLFTQHPLPRNANGKLLKRQIREALITNPPTPESAS